MVVEHNITNYYRQHVTPHRFLVGPLKEEVHLVFRCNYDIVAINLGNQIGLWTDFYMQT